MVDGSGLENQRCESIRGFESHPLRSFLQSNQAMTVNRLVLALGSIIGLIAIVAWIGELDVVLYDSVPKEQPTKTQQQAQ